MTATTTATTTHHPDAKSVVIRYLQALRDRDIDAIPELIAPHATYRIPGDHPVAGTWSGLDEITENFFTPLGKLFDPEAEYLVDVSHVIAEGNQVSVECVTSTTTVHGMPYAIDISAHFTVEDGLITSMREFFDTQYFARILFGQS